MSVSVMESVTRSPDVQGFLRQRNAESEFQRTLELACSCYPDRINISVFLQEDWEVAGWWMVIIEVTIPATLSLDQFQGQKARFVDLLVEQMPPSEFNDRVCLVRTRFVER